MANDSMTVKVMPNDKGNPPGKLADAELHFTAGPLEGLKLAGLHNDLKADDVFHWYTSTAWVMWNCQVGGLTPLTSVSTNADGTTAINGGLVATSGNQLYGDAVVIGANTALTSSAGNITFGT